MTFEIILDVLKKLCLHNVSIHRNFEQNGFINECARKKKANPIIPESRSFLVIYRRTYVLKNYVPWSCRRDSIHLTLRFCITRHLAREQLFLQIIVYHYVHYFNIGFLIIISKRFSYPSSFTFYKTFNNIFNIIHLRYHH